MVRRYFRCSAVGICLLTLAAVASAKVMAPPPLALRLAVVDAVVVGKITKIEDKLIQLAAAPGTKEKVEYQVAVVEIKDGLYGVKGLTHVNLAYQPGQGGRRFPQLDFKVGQEAAFFLTRHFDEPYFLTPMYWDVSNKANNPTFDADVKETKRLAKLLEEPTASLQSKDADERFLTAAMLVSRYRTQKTGTEKPTQIDAAESKLILSALAGAEWDAKTPKYGYQLTPLALFQKLGLTEKDGWTPPKDFKQIPTEAQAWLKKNTDSYRIVRFDAPKKDK